MKAKRVIYVKVPPEEKGNLDRFLEKLSKALRTQDAILRIEGDRVRIEVHGGKARIRDTIIHIKRLISEYKVTGSTKYSYKPGLIFKRVGSAIPLDALALLLNLEGWEAEYREGTLLTNAKLEDVVTMGILLKDSMDKVSFLSISTSVKKALAVAMIETGRSGQELIERALDEDLIFEHGKRLVPRTSWIDLAKTLISSEKSQVEGG